MENSDSASELPAHLRLTEPSAWVTRFATLAPEGGTVLDLACGGGRHTRYFLRLGFKVTAIDRDIRGLADLGSDPHARLIEADLEDGSPWPLAGHTFGAVVVTNYLHRPLFGHLLDSLAPGGVLIYETFGRGNEAYSKPRNPDHLLKSGELLALAAGRLQVIAYEHGICVTDCGPGVVQRIAAINTLGAAGDGEPDPVALNPA